MTRHILSIFASLNLRALKLHFVSPNTNSRTTLYLEMQPIPVASACGSSLAGTAGSKPVVSMDVCVVCYTVKARAQARTIKTWKQVRKNYKERTREGIQKKKFRRRYECRLWVLCVAAGTGLCDGPITRPADRPCVTVCDHMQQQTPCTYNG